MSDYENFKKRYIYTEDDKIGEGGFGAVFRAWDKQEEKYVALKIARVIKGHEFVRLQKEVLMAKSLDKAKGEPGYRNIAQYLDCYTFDLGLPGGLHDFGILEYYEHGNLLQLIERTNLSHYEIASILRQVLTGLNFLHGQGVIHRDLKPENILVVKHPDGEYVPKITDFGISKKLEGKKNPKTPVNVTEGMVGVGTRFYSSPEQMAARTIRENTDLWSFGIVAYQAFTGELPFTTGEHEADSETGRAELLAQIMAGEVPDDINMLDRQWRMLIRRCLVVDPNRRIGCVAECLGVLDFKDRPDDNHDGPDDDDDDVPDDDDDTPDDYDVPNEKPSSVPLINCALIAICAVLFVLILFFVYQFKRNSKPTTKSNRGMLSFHIWSRSIRIERIKPVFINQPPEVPCQT